MDSADMPVPRRCPDNLHAPGGNCDAVLSTVGKQERSRRLSVSRLRGLTGRTDLPLRLASHPESNDISLACDAYTVIEASIPDVLRVPCQSQRAWWPAEARVQEEANDRHPFRAAAGWTFQFVHVALSPSPVAIPLIISTHRHQ
jgi:hypothetical protein